MNCLQSVIKRRYFPPELMTMLDPDELVDFAYRLARVGHV